jgi:hypothetical protein
MLVFSQAQPERRSHSLFRPCHPQVSRARLPCIGPLTDFLCCIIIICSVSIGLVVTGSL